jgi:hypothetical protein
LICRVWIWLVCGATIVPLCASGRVAYAEPGELSQKLNLEPAARERSGQARRTATIHWQGVPLREAIARLRPLFSDAIFLDRRVDPELRVSLDIDATTAEQVASALASGRELGTSRVGKVIYLGPAASAKRLRLLLSAHARKLAQLPADQRTGLAGRHPFHWPRLSEPRQLVSSIAERSGWRVRNPELIPHDLWAAAELPELNELEQLTLLLIGFDLSFELRPDRTLKIVALEPLDDAQAFTAGTRTTAPKPQAARSAQGKKQVYTLRVQEKPESAILRELGQRLHWVIQIDEPAIRAAGKSLDHRVSFSVENADQQELLAAVLTPAGLECQIDGNTIRVIPARYSN